MYLINSTILLFFPVCVYLLISTPPIIIYALPSTLVSLVNARQLAEDGGEYASLLSTVSINPVSPPTGIRRKSFKDQDYKHMRSSFIRYDVEPPQILNLGSNPIYGEIQLTCPSGYTLVHKKCVKTVTTKPTISCPYGSYRNAARECISVDSVVPERVCPHGFEAYEYGCVRRNVLPPLPACSPEYLYDGNKCVDKKTEEPISTCDDPINKGNGGMMVGAGGGILTSGGMCEVEIYNKAEGYCPKGYRYSSSGGECMKVINHELIRGCPYGYTLSTYDKDQKDNTATKIDAPDECLKIEQIEGKPYCFKGFNLSGNECVRETLTQPQLSCSHGFTLSSSVSTLPNAVQDHINSFPLSSLPFCFRVNLDESTVPHCRNGWVYDFDTQKCTYTIEEDPVYSCASNSNRSISSEEGGGGNNRENNNSGIHIYNTSKNTSTNIRGVLDDYNEGSLTLASGNNNNKVYIRSLKSSSGLEYELFPASPPLLPSELKKTEASVRYISGSSEDINDSGGNDKGPSSSASLPSSFSSCVHVEIMKPLETCREAIDLDLYTDMYKEKGLELGSNTDNEGVGDKSCVKRETSKPSYKIDCSLYDNSIGESISSKNVPVCLLLRTTNSITVGCKHSKSLEFYDDKPEENPADAVVPISLRRLGVLSDRWRKTNSIGRNAISSNDENHADRTTVSTNQLSHAGDNHEDAVSCAEVRYSAVSFRCPDGVSHKVGKSTCKQILVYPPDLTCPSDMYMQHNNNTSNNDENSDKNDSRSSRVCISEVYELPAWKCPSDYHPIGDSKGEVDRNDSVKLHGPTKNIIMPNFITNAKFSQRLRAFDNSLGRMVKNTNKKENKIAKTDENITSCEKVEFATVQVACPLGYRMEAEGKKRLPGKGCIAEKRVPSTPICEPGYFMEDNGVETVCVKHVEITPSIFTADGIDQPCAKGIDGSMICGAGEYSKAYDSKLKQKHFDKNKIKHDKKDG